MWPFKRKTKEPEWFEQGLRSGFCLGVQYGLLMGARMFEQVEVDVDRESLMATTGRVRLHLTAVDGQLSGDAFETLFLQTAQQVGVRIENGGVLVVSYPDGSGRTMRATIDSMVVKLK